MNKKVVFTVLSVVYLILLFIGAFVVKASDISKASNFDKVLHLIGFLILAILLLLTFEHYKLGNKYISVFLVALGIGILIEAIQLGIPGREFSISDILANILGIIIGEFLTWSFSKH